MRALRSLGPILLPSFLLACVSLPTVSAQSDLAFEPYSVFVAEQDVFARCGPSSDYYRTDSLRHGQSLEVYAETDDGWLGVRPPEDSFCWIPAETVEEGAGDSATVVEDRTVAWIGTHLGRARTYRWQVQLAKGEPVTILGRSEREGPDGPQLWLRIVPPSGEFRWVHRTEVVTNSESLVASADDDSIDDGLVYDPIDQDDSLAERPKSSRRRAGRRSKPNESKMADSSGSSILQSGSSDGRESSEPREAIGSGAVGQSPARQSDSVAATAGQVAPVPSGQAATNVASTQPKNSLASVAFLSRPRLLEIGSRPSAPSENETASDANWVAGSGRGSLTDQQPITSMAGTYTGSGIVQTSGQQLMNAPGVATAFNTQTVVPAERLAQIEAEAANADLERLSLLFSRLMAAQATAAETEPIERAARRLASSTIDVVAAGRARELAERAQRYRRVAQQRHGNAIIRQTGAYAPVPVPQNAAMPAAMTPPVGGTPLGSTIKAEVAPTTATQSGYLVQVYSARTNSPPFALTDARGRTVAYVSPAPGVNLRIHLNNKVQVIGNAGFVTGLNTPHILATQVERE